MKNSFVLYTDWLPMFENMTKDARSEIVLAIFQYAAGKEYVLTDPTAQAIFPMILATMQRDADRYEETCEKNRSNGAKGGRPKTEQNRPVLEETDRKPDEAKKPDYEYEYDNDSVIEKEKQAKEKPGSRRASFVKPTVEEVADYCIERHNAVDPEQFVDFYDSKGWKIGKEPMRDWKAAVRTWEKRETREPPKAQPKARQPDKWQYQDQRVYDYDALEKALLGRAYE